LPVALYTEDEIVLAVRRGEITPYFQPQVDIDTGEIVAAEALSRWLHPDVGVLLPAAYVPTAESGGSIVDIDRRMLALSCRYAREWSRRDATIEFSVNVSASRVAAGGLEADVLACLAINGVAPELLTIELTESQALSEVDGAPDVLAALIAHGVGVSVDDYGAGHADEALLDRIPATELKIDRSLLEHDDPAGAADAARLAHERGLRLVAEGVSTHEQWALARRLGCHRAQGFLFSEPVSPRDFLKMLPSSR
jgi:EAL domain-containing protein (putative c-di-GMP-specific phosphodiesterase class I)